MRIKELVKELKKCKGRLPVVYIDYEGEESKLGMVVQVDDGGWDQVTFVTERAYEGAVGSKKFFREMDTDYMKLYLDYEFGDTDRFDISMFSGVGNLNFFDYEVGVCEDINGAAWGVQKDLRCSIIDGQKFAIIGLVEEEQKTQAE